LQGIVASGVARAGKKRAGQGPALLAFDVVVRSKLFHEAETELAAVVVENLQHVVDR
jgi:hypothetical protein